MTNIDDLKARIEALEAKEAIRDLVTAYAIACDEHDMPRLASLFAEDAEFDSPSGVMRASGRDAIVNMFVELFKVRGPGYHWTHDVSIDIDKDRPGQATGLVLSHAETTPHGIVSLAAMKYFDTYKKIDGSWVFAKREINFLYYVPATKYTEGLNATNRFSFGSDWLRADYPENYDSWRAFEDAHIKK